MTSWNPVTLVSKAARNSPWIVMAVALHLILLATATIFYTSRKTTSVADPDQKITLVDPRRVDDAVIEPPPEIDRKPLSDVKPIELSERPDEWVVSDAVPSPQDAGDPTADAMLPPGFSDASSATGVGKVGQVGNGPHPTFTRGPNVITGPGGGPTGSNKQTEAIVLGGMRWLARHQNEDGSWGAVSMKSRCDPGHCCCEAQKNYVASYDEGLTGLALLTFLGAGYSHESEAFFKDPARGNQVVKVGPVVKAGLKWLVKHENSDGSFGQDRAFMYNQALATMALCEAYGLTQNRVWREPAQRAVDYLQGAQRPSPTGNGMWGWRYASRQDIERSHGGGDTLDAAYQKELYDADTSVTGWAVMALKSARMSGLEVKDEALEGGLAFVKWVSTGDGMAGYLDAKSAGAKVQGPDDHFDYHAAGMSALSMCVRAFAAHDADDPFLEMAAKRVVADLPRVSKDGLSVDYYYWYYGSLALNQFDGPMSPRRGAKYWGPWNKAMVTAVGEGQQKSAGDCGEGGWLAPDRWAHSGGPIYATAINVLTMEVYYRYPNAFSARVAGRGGPQAVK